MSKKGITLALCLAASSLAFAAKNEQEMNKDVVTRFYQKAINDKDFAAAETYMGPWYIQHNPLAKDGIEGFKQYVDYLKSTYPESHSEIKRVLAEGDYVILHVHSIKEPGTRGQAIIDIFRLENNKIVEHWDVVQNIPENAANSNGMF
ncbi:polyketide cyclase [Legionella taurinensis]|uniref:Polyketide cyclase n=1 Tax=Legionella taurinensis TaxID=70611 RepID=A0A3A5LDD9_9GAMM|nr:ester cyclase [Legionella taurinensis]MDX1838387.1 ester cyclase [Legionella taurinensis]PUT39146.1 polyketide cyclase [Legionella taurinensis]PUT39771.1 polyketide cyclase [Legionella taurinensis]PUT43602.1 polyketide cyclase [Legionella taurinensis]PUT45258.1 polyketide cyclase [Legionella taurinensis]